MVEKTKLYKQKQYKLHSTVYRQNLEIVQIMTRHSLRLSKSRQKHRLEITQIINSLEIIQDMSSCNVSLSLSLSLLSTVLFFFFVFDFLDFSELLAKKRKKRKEYAEGMPQQSGNF